MLTIFLSAGILLTVAVLGFVSLRPFPQFVRICLDAALFVAVTGFLVERDISPFFPIAAATAGDAAIWLRVLVGTWWFLAARTVVAILWLIRPPREASRDSRLYSELTTAVIYIGTGLVVLNSVLSVPIAGVLATSGVIAIVLGLALQNTLSDVFAGIAVRIDAPFNVGDRIQIDNAIEGVVGQADWRSIRIYTDNDDVAVLPNSLIAKAQIVNRSSPTKRRAASVELFCSAFAPPERVIEKLLEATLLCPTILQSPTPSVTLTRIGFERNTFSVTFSVADTILLGATKDALLRHGRQQLNCAGYLTSRAAPGQFTTCRALSACELLRSVVLFEPLLDSQIAGLAGKVRERSLETGEVLFAQATIDATLYVIADGILEISRATDGPAVALGNLGAGDYIGEIGLLTGAPHAATATALVPSHIYELSHEAIAPLLAENRDLASAFEKSARRGLALVRRDVAARATEDAGPRGQLLLKIRAFFSIF